MKTNAQFSAMRKGALDISLYPISYAGGELPELNIGLMPGLVTSYEQGAPGRTRRSARSSTRFLADKGVIIVSWIWQAGGVRQPRDKPIVSPEDAKGLKVRGGSREMDMMLQAAGAAVLSTAVERDLCRRCRPARCDAAHHVVDQPDLVPARGSWRRT